MRGAPFPMTVLIAEIHKLTEKDINREIVLASRALCRARHRTSDFVVYVAKHVRRTVSGICVEYVGQFKHSLVVFAR